MIVIQSSIIKILLIILGLYSLIVAFLYVMQRSLLYFPDRTKPILTEEMLERRYEEITVHTQDDLKLSAWYRPAEDENAKIFVLFHGNAGHIGLREFKSDYFGDRGFGFLLAEYRGYGGNPGQPSEENFYKDARAYMNWLIKEKNISPQQIIIMGASLGSGVAVQISTEFNIGAVILEASFDSALHVAQERYPIVPVSLLMKDQFQSINKIDRIQAPILFLHGAKDAGIDPKYSRILYEQADEPKRYVLIPQAGHNNMYDHDAALHILDFLSTIESK